jgi:hypothetical protein
MADEHLDTASQRRPTGMDAGARKLILEAIARVASSARIVEAFFKDRYGNWDDYYAAVEEVWGGEAEWLVRSAVEQARSEHATALTGSDQAIAVKAIFEALLLAMPEPDFRLAVGQQAGLIRARGLADRLTEICRRRGAPWRFDPFKGFQWTGDREIEASAIRPALDAIDDPRLGGSKSEFDQARSELALGSPAALKQCVTEAAAAVESAMRVLLEERGHPPAANAAAATMFQELVEHAIVPRYMERVILGASMARNKSAGHGAGATPHDVPAHAAEAVLASAAVAITYLQRRLP